MSGRWAASELHVHIDSAFYIYVAYSWQHAEIVVLGGSGFSMYRGGMYRGGVPAKDSPHTAKAPLYVFPSRSWCTGGVPGYEIPCPISHWIPRTFKLNITIKGCTGDVLGHIYIYIYDLADAAPDRLVPGHAPIFACCHIYITCFGKKKKRKCF